SAMVGREMAANHRGTVAQNGAIILSVHDLTLDTLSREGWRRTLHGVSFQLRRGEILGIGGLLGSGRTEILESIFGVARGWRGGDIMIDGVTVDIKSPADAYRLGVALVTEDRKERGLHLAASICDNVGAKQEIYRLIFELAAQGLGILVVTSEMPELLLLSDRILVMCEGRQTGVLRREDATQETVMRLAAPGMAAQSWDTPS